MKNLFRGCNAVAACVLAVGSISLMPIKTHVLAGGQENGRRGANTSSANISSAEAQRIFISNGAFCHGADARGGDEGGPDLTRPSIATSGAFGLEAFLKVGRPARMPGFDLPGDQVMAVASFLAVQSSVSRGAVADPRVRLVGDTEAGKKYFKGAGKCTSCHSVDGDLKGIGAKYTPQLLQRRMILVRGSRGYSQTDLRAS